MSSKLIRNGDAKASRALAWRPGQTSGAYISGSNAADASSDANLKNEWEARTQAAFQQGQAAGIQQASQRIEPAAASLNKVVAEIASAGKQFRAQAEGDTVKLAIAIARRVLHRELATDPDAILGLVIAAFQKLNARETHRLRLSSADAATVQEHRSLFDFPPSLEITADPALPSGSAIFETSRGELDASVDTQLAEIDRGFADLVKRRAR